MANASVKLKNVRIVWPSLFQARKVDQNNPAEEAKYSASFLIPKDTDEGKAAIAAMRDAIKSIAAAAWPGDAKALKSDKQPMRDGDSEDAPNWAKGCVYFRAKAKRAPGVFDTNPKNRIEEHDGRPQGGDFVNVALGLFSYDGKFGKGVSAGLDAVQFVASGEPIGGAPRAGSDAFDDISGSSTAVGSGDGADLPF